MGQRVRHADDVRGAEAAGGVHDARRRGADVLGRDAVGTGRLAWLDALLPLPVIEVSHFVGSLVGFGLLVVAWGLARRLDAAYYLAVVRPRLGIVASLLKGADYEEALVLAALLVMLVASRESSTARPRCSTVPSHRHG